MAVSIRLTAAVAAALVAAVPAAKAADVMVEPPMYQAPVVEYNPPAYYARIDCGYAVMQKPDMIVGDMREHFVAKNGGRIDVDNEHFCDVGVGHYFMDHGRFDVTVGYRGPVHVTGIADFDSLGSNGNGGEAVNQEAKVQSLVTLFNLYWDIANVYGVTPYVGAGLGFAYNDLDDVLVPESGFYTKGGTNVDLAWALMAGLTAPLSDSVAVDAGYRYINWGGVTSGSLGSHGRYTTPVKIDDLSAHEFRVGLRYSFY